MEYDRECRIVKEVEKLRGVDVDYIELLRKERDRRRKE